MAKELLKSEAGISARPVRVEIYYDETGKEFLSQTLTGKLPKPLSVFPDGRFVLGEEDQGVINFKQGKNISLRVRVTPDDNRSYHCTIGGIFRVDSVIKLVNETPEHIAEREASQRFLEDLFNALAKPEYAEFREVRQPFI